MPTLEPSPIGIYPAEQSSGKRRASPRRRNSPVELSALIELLTRSVSEKYSPGLIKIDISVTNIKVEGDMVNTTRKSVGRDTYNARVSKSSDVAIAQGGRSKASVKARDRVAITGASPDLKALASELDQLRVAMRAEGRDVEHDESLALVGQAQKAAETGDTKTVMDRLKGAGSWALGIANKLALTAASQAIEDAIRS